MVILSIAAIFVLVSLVLSISPKRQAKISAVISDLEKYKVTSSPETHYAINENIVFFKAIRTFLGYCYWGFSRRRKIDPNKLLEIADLPLPRWEKELYSDLSHVERKEFPGLSKPLRKLLVDHIASNNAAVLLDLGCGSMEVERQTLVMLKRKSLDANPIFIGVDSAPQALQAIEANFEDLQQEVDIKKLDSLKDFNPKTLNKPTIFFYCGDALEVADLHGHKYDLIFSSRFRHHLNKDEKARIDSISHRLTHYVIEYDDYHTSMSWLPPVLTAWYRPILLSAANFSQIRQPSKKSLMKQKSLKQSSTKVLLFRPPGSYAKIFMSNTTNSREISNA